jgi:hypothetical protein
VSVTVRSGEDQSVAELLATCSCQACADRSIDAVVVFKSSINSSEALVAEPICTSVINNGLKDGATVAARTIIGDPSRTAALIKLAKMYMYFFTTRIVWNVA